ncbi:hypothetical protein NPIL_701311 [Nephila pilipes]|uniref:Uncharacterized protein n=1 Tax=Nephila pilipes TaxID=299642 RepID=A0A8X6MXL1_NEPPI|nr:hypothetical protein NPIL_701311 [Nephila pilipes]
MPSLKSVERLRGKEYIYEIREDKVHPFRFSSSLRTLHFGVTVTGFASFLHQCDKSSTRFSDAIPNHQSTYLPTSKLLFTEIENKDLMQKIIVTISHF